MLEIVENMLCCNHVILSQEMVEKSAQSAIEVLKKELPEEAHTKEVLNYVISRVKEILDEKKIVL